jgi:uncharacterized protein Yka (UPF0111/DUF47 family)
MTMLSEHMKVVKDIVDRTMDALRAYEQNDNAAVRNHHDEIITLERKADVLRNSIMKRWAVVDSPQKYSAMGLVETIDLIADYCEDTSLLLIMRSGSIPADIHNEFNDFLTKVQGTVDMLQQSIDLSSKFSKKFCRDCEYFKKMYDGSAVGTCEKLDQGHAMGFRPEESVCEVEKAEVLHVMTDDVGVKEEEADVLERNFRKMAYNEELGLNPIQTIHFLHIVNNTDYIANTAKDAANSLKRLF